MNESSAPFHISLLQNQLQARKSRNRRYSLRAFANYLELHPSALSRIMSNKQHVSTKVCVTILRKLALSEEETEKFVESIAQNRVHQISDSMSRAVSSPEQYFARLHQGA